MNKPDSPGEHFRLRVQDRDLELVRFPVMDPQGTILLIHEALGSVTYWKEFPSQLAEATRCTVIAYSRAGHGSSEGPVAPRNLEYYKHQVDTVLPVILTHFAVESPVLYGHSEGAGIALMYGASHPELRAIIAECPIVTPEEQTSETIGRLAADYATSDLSQRLGRYHVDPDAVFHAWIASHRSSFYKELPLASYLARIHCPVLVLQGSKDQFGGFRQFEAIQSVLPATQHTLYEAGHLLHREVPIQVAERVAAFLESLQATPTIHPSPSLKST